MCKHMTKLGVEIPWSCETRVDIVDRPLLSTMKHHGCQLIGFGVEAGTQRVIDTIKKGITLNQVRKAFRWCDELGIESLAYMMLGCPTETEAEILESIRFVKSLPADFVQWSICTPYLGTELYKQAVERGVRPPENYEDWVYVNLGSIGKTKYQFIANENLTLEELNGLQVRGYKEFYLRSAYIWRRLMKSFSLRGLMTNISGFKMFMEAIR